MPVNGSDSRQIFDDTPPTFASPSASARRDRQIGSLTDLSPLRTKRFAIPFDATGKKWVRFAIWDSAGNGAFVQPVWLDAVRPTTSAQGQ